MHRSWLTLVWMTCLTAACAREAFLRPEQALAMRTQEGGELAYPTPEGGELIGAEADVTIFVRPGAAFQLDEPGSRMQVRGGPHGTAVAVDLAEDGLWGTARGVGARIGAQNVFVPAESIGWVSVREERSWALVFLVAGAAIPLGLAFAVFSGTGAE